MEGVISSKLEDGVEAIVLGSLRNIETAYKVYKLNTNRIEAIDKVCVEAFKENMGTISNISSFMPYNVVEQLKGRHLWGKLELCGTYKNEPNTDTLLRFVKVLCSVEGIELAKQLHSEGLTAEKDAKTAGQVAKAVG